MPVEARSAISTIWKIFFSALAIRWAYALVLFTAMGEPGLKGVDSYTYVEVAHQFAEAMATGSVHGWDWLGPQTAIMPLYNTLTVSYTHLRAHETVLDLVCRLLLEKKK